MQTIERQATYSLAAVFALRLFGLVTVLPVLALSIPHFKHATPLLIGLALGIYGLTQALLQLPLGILSDRIGRKPVMTLGLLILAAGSLLCATSTHIVGLIIGRALQGACAISSTLMATLSDLLRSDQRTKAMAILGATFGLVFSVSMVAGSILNNWIGIQGIFWLTAGFALLAILITHTWMPTPAQASKENATTTAPPKTVTRLKSIACDPALWRINLSVTTQHALLIANFTALPLILAQVAKLPADHLWHLYLPTMLGAFIVMLPLIVLIEKYRYFKAALVSSVSALFLAECGLWVGRASITGVAVSLFIFFTAFALLEALLPSLTSRLVAPTDKGAAMGFYSTGQFLGMFLGGLGGGAIYHYLAAPYVFLSCAATVLLWLFTLLSIKLDISGPTTALNSTTTV